MSFSIRLTEQERNIADSYARLHSMSLSAAFQQALFETMDARYFEILETIRTTGKLEADTEEAIQKAITEVLAQFTAAV